MRRVVASLMPRAPGGGAGARPSTPVPSAARCRPRPRRAAAPPAARRPRVRSRALTVRVVVVPPLVGRRLRVAGRRVLPLLLAAERRQVEVGPGAAHRLVTALVDEVGAEDLALVVAEERVRAVPLPHAEVGVEVVGERVPRDL